MTTIEQDVYSRFGEAKARTISRVDPKRPLAFKKVTLHDFSRSFSEAQGLLVASTGLPSKKNWGEWTASVTRKNISCAGKVQRICLLYKLAWEALDSPSWETYQELCTKVPFPGLINKLRLYPMPGLAVKLWSLCCSIEMALNPTGLALSWEGKIVSCSGVFCCFESLVTRSDITAMDYMVSGSSVFVVDSTSETDPERVFEKMAKLCTQVTNTKTPFSVKLVPVLQFHPKCKHRDFMFNHDMSHQPLFSKSVEIAECYKGKTTEWKTELLKCVEEEMCTLFDTLKADEDPTFQDSALAQRMKAAYLTGTIQEKLSVLSQLPRDNPFHSENLISLWGSLRCGKIRPTVPYSGAVQFNTLEDVREDLQELLKIYSEMDPVMRAVCRLDEIEDDNTYWLMDTGAVEPCPRQVLEQEAEDIDYPQGCYAVGTNLRPLHHKSEGFKEVRCAMNPAYMLDETEFAKSAFQGRGGRSKEGAVLRPVTLGDVLGSEVYKSELMEQMSKKCLYNSSLNLGSKKRWIGELGSEAINGTAKRLYDDLSEIELGSALNHQFEIAMMVQNSVQFGKKHRLVLCRNGNNLSHTLIKCSAGPSAFKNCPIRVFWVSERDYRVKHQCTTQPWGEVFIRTTKWHNTDARQLKWMTDQSLAVEARLATLISVDATNVEGPEDLVQCALPCWPNTQDFSKLCGPVKNVIDGLESVQSDPSGIISKYSGMVVQSMLELWYVSDYLSTFFIARVLHSARMFEDRGELRARETGSIVFKFPELRKATSHPELLTNFQNTFHLVVKFKVNKTAPEARDFLAVVGEKEIFDAKFKTREDKKLINFGTTKEDLFALKSTRLDKQQVVKSLRATWAVSGLGKKGSRYSWNLWYMLAAAEFDERVNGDLIREDEEEFWQRCMGTSVDEFLVSTGSMAMSGIDLLQRQAQRKSTSVYELMWMALNNSSSPPTNIKSELTKMMSSTEHANVTLGSLVVFCLRKGGGPALIRMLDKDQVEGDREISALDAISMLCCSMHEKSWATFSRRHPVDKIMSSDKSRNMKDMRESHGEIPDNLAVAIDNTDCNRYGPNVDLEMDAILCNLKFSGPRAAISTLGCQMLYNKKLKAPEGLVSAYVKALNSKEGVTLRSGDVNLAFWKMKTVCTDGALEMRGGMGQGILGIGNSCISSICTQFTNHLLQKSSNRIIRSTSMVTSDDGHSEHLIKKKGKYATVKWITACRTKSMSMGNNIINPTKSGMNFHVKNMNSIRMNVTPEGTLIETTPFFKFLITKVALPESMSFVEDCIKANLYGADLLKMGIPAEVVAVNVVHSLMLCYHLHKKWVFLSDRFTGSEHYGSIPALLGGPIGPCFVETCVTPLASVYIYSGGLFDLTNFETCEMFAKAILKPQLVEDTEGMVRDSDFGDAPALYKKSADGLRYARRPNKNDRRAFKELFRPGFSPPGVPNLIFSSEATSLADTTSTFIHKLVSGKSGLGQPNNKYLMSVGDYRKSYTSDCITVPEGTPVANLLPPGTRKISPEFLKDLLSSLTPEQMVSAIVMTSESRAEEAKSILKDSGKLYDALLAQLTSKLLLVAEARELLGDLHHYAVPMSPHDRVVRLNPMTTANIRIRRDVINLEKEIKKKIFLEMSGKDGADYMFDRFGLHVGEQGEAKMGLIRAMEVADQYSAVILEFLTLKDRQVRLRGRMAISDDKSFFSQVLRYNISYNREYPLDDSGIMGVYVHPLKEFVDQIWTFDVEERAIKANNALVLSELINLNPDRTPLYLSNSNPIRTLDDLYTSSLSTDLFRREEATFELRKGTRDFSKLLRYACALRGEVKMSGSDFYSTVAKNSHRSERTGLGKVWVEEKVFQVLDHSFIGLDVTKKVSEDFYAHDILSLSQDFLEVSPQVKTLNTADDFYYPVHLPGWVSFKTNISGSHISTNLTHSVAPLLRLELVDFDFEALLGGELHEEDLGTCTRGLITNEMSSSAVQESVRFVCSGLEVPQEVAAGYLGGYGTNGKYNKMMALSLQGKELRDLEPSTSADLSFADTFCRLVSPLDVRLSPLARVAVHSWRRSTKPKTTKVPKLHSQMRFMGNKFQVTKEDVEAISGLVRATVGVKEASETREEAPELNFNFDDMDFLESDEAREARAEFGRGFSSGL